MIEHVEYLACGLACRRAPSEHRFGEVRTSENNGSRSVWTLACWCVFLVRWRSPTPAGSVSAA